MNVICALLLLLPTAPNASTASNGATVSKDIGPAWVNASDGLSDGTYLTKITIGPEATREACEKQVLDAARTAVDDHSWRLNQLRGDGSTKPPLKPLTDEELERRVIGEKWEERVTIEGADRVFLHVQLKFDPDLQSQWREAALAWGRDQRTWRLSLLLLAGMWVVAVAYAALRVDGKLTTKPSRAVLWTTAVILAAIPLLVIS
jgi:hypothetical protein